jgi:glyceraldehyde-3-phosphate dehydrogenase (NADP+)
MRIQNLHDGRWFAGRGPAVPVQDPWSSDVVGTVESASPEECRPVIRDIHKNRSDVGGLPVWKRKALLEALADRLRAAEEPLLAALVREGGKTRRESMIEIARAVEGTRATAAALVGLQGAVVPMDALTSGEGRLGWELWEPAGVVAAIAPFNAPLHLVASKVAAALGAGCPVIIKPPLEAPTAATILAQSVLDAGWPRSAVAVLHGGADVGTALVAAPQVRVVAFTGSTAAGEAITRTAGIKKLVLELGSIAPTFVCADADPERAAELLVRGAFGSSGQACISTQLLFVHASMWDAFMSDFVARVEGLVVGDPADEATDLGPMINDAAAERTMALIERARAAGATIHTGGRRMGRCVWPTVISGLPLDAEAITSEIFGPVVVAIRFDEDDQAIAMANESEFGLQAGVFTRDIDRAIRYARSLEYGSVQINESSRVRLDIHSFGGVKKSGIGREGVQHLLREMMTIKFVGLLTNQADHS